MASKSYKLQWTSSALKDLSEIRDYIKKDKPIAAKKEATRIRQSVERLLRFPESGKKSSDIVGVREIISGNYRIFYRIKKTAIHILRIYHGRRLVTPMTSL